MPGYISEVSEGGGGIDDFVEVAVPEGTDVSSYQLVVYESDGEVRDGPFSFPALSSSTGGQDIYLFDDSTVGLGSFGLSDGIALIDDSGTVLQFISFEGNTITATEGPASGETSTDIGTHDSGESLQSDNGGASYATQTNLTPGTLPCFAPGTLIRTPSGPRAVELLRPGDLVVTRDRGAMPVRFVQRRTARRRRNSSGDAPILIRVGALGPNRPERDLVVSSQHRILLGGAAQCVGCLDGEYLAPAKALVDLPRVRMMLGRRKVIWHHFALDTHSLVIAEGCWVETLLLGAMVLPGLTALPRRLLAQHFADNPADGALNGPPTRPLLTVAQTRNMITKTSAP